MQNRSSVAQRLLWIVGVGPNEELGLPERRWYLSLGSSVVLTSGLAFLSMIVLLLGTGGFSAFAALPLALVWAFGVFSVDALIVNHIEYVDRSARGLSSVRAAVSAAARVLLRLALIGAIALLVSEPLILTVFEREVTRQVQSDLANEADAATGTRLAAANRAVDAQDVGQLTLLTAQVTDAQDRYDAQDRKTRDELAGTGVTGEPGRGREFREDLALTKRYADELAVAKANLDGFKSQSVGRHAAAVDGAEQAIADERATILASDGLVARSQALHNLETGPNGLPVLVWHVALLVALLVLDLFPMASKMFRGETQHTFRAKQDLKVAMKKAEAEAEWLIESHARVLQAKSRHLAEVLRNQSFSFDFLDSSATRVLPAVAGDPPTRVIDVVPAVDPNAPTPGFDPFDPARTHPERPDVGSVVDGAWELVRRLSVFEAHPPARGELWIARRAPKRGRRQDPGEYFFKLIPLTSLDRGKALKYLKSEASVFRPHRNIAENVDYGVTEDDWIYLVSCYYREGDLGRYVERLSYKPPLAWSVAVTDNIMAGLEFAHSVLGVCHFDLKPQNVVLDQGQARIIDWGLAKKIESPEHQVSSEIRGTVRFSAPEQFTRYSGGPDERSQLSDLYSAAATLFWLITGAAPLDGPAERAGIDKADGYSWIAWLGRELPTATRADALEPSCPRALADLLARWLAHDPDQRVSGVHLNDPVRLATAVRQARAQLRPFLPRSNARDAG